MLAAILQGWAAIVLPVLCRDAPLVADAIPAGSAPVGNEASLALDHGSVSRGQSGWAMSQAMTFLASASGGNTG